MCVGVNQVRGRKKLIRPIQPIIHRVLAEARRAANIRARIAIPTKLDCQRWPVSYTHLDVYKRQRYASAWERTDLDGLVGLLANDATMVMPPWSLWYSGRANIRSLFEWAWRVLSEGGSYKMVATRANSQVAFGTYLRRPGETQYHAHVFQVLTFRKGRIGRLSLFVGPDHFPKFRLAPSLDASS